MNSLLNPRMVLRVCGVLMLLHSLMWMFVSGANIDAAIPNISDDALLMLVNTNEAVASFNLFFAILILASSTLELNGQRVITKALSVCFLLLTVLAVYHMVGYPQGYGPPPPIPIIFGLLTIWSGYISFIIKD